MLDGAGRSRSSGTPTTSYDTSRPWESLGLHPRHHSSHVDSEILDAVEFCLLEWGRWARQQPIYLGYPSSSAESQAGLGRRDKRSGPKSVDEHPLAAVVEAAVVDLPDLLHTVVRKEYLDGRGIKRQRARDLRMGETRYSQLIRSAQYAVQAAIKNTDEWRVVVRSMAVDRAP